MNISKAVISNIKETLNRRLYELRLQNDARTRDMKKIVEQQTIAKREIAKLHELIRNIDV